MHNSIGPASLTGEQSTDLEFDGLGIRLSDADASHPFTYATPVLTTMVRRRRREGGSSIVEFALASTVFFTLFIGLLNGAFYLFARSSVTNAARDAARQGIVNSPFCDSSPSGKVVAAAKSNAGPFSNSISVTAAQGNDSTGMFCQVSVQYAYSPIGGAFGFGTSTIQSTSKEYQN